MTHTFKLARRVARFRTGSLVLTLLAASACTADLTSDPSTPANAFELSSAVSTASGIVFGAFNVDNSQLGSPYGGSMRQPGPKDILPLLSGAQAKGGKLVVKLGDSDRTTQNSDGTFSLEKWKAQIDRFKQVNIQPYISDGTLIGHFLISEPEDASNWGGRKIPQSTLEEMAKYSKQLWPGLTTFVFSQPTYLASSGIKYQYLDAGWATYHSWNGDISTWTKSQVSAAKKAGIGLILGLDVLEGGTSSSGIKASAKGRYAMSGSQLRSWGSTLLNESYACGFFNWRYDATYNGRSEIQSAMSYLSQMAQSHQQTSCRQGDGLINPTVPVAETPPVTSPKPIEADPKEPEVPSPPTTPDTPSSPGSGIVFGQFRMPNSLLSSTYTGVFRAPAPNNIVSTLAEARARGGRVLVQFSDRDAYVQNSDGTFNLGKWKAQVARFKGVNFSSFINDGTLIGHYLLDEPDDPSNWGGRRIPPETVEEMARYSKELWPGLTTIIRSSPTYLTSTGMRFQYLDAGWAMYESWQRPSDVSTWIQYHVSKAKAARLGLMVGLNVLDGGTAASGIGGFTKGSGRYAMSASQLRSWGSILLNEPYVCGFYNFAYSSSYYDRSDIKSAMSELSQRAKSHAKASCRQ